jgi:hypothetical protein
MNAVTPFRIGLLTDLEWEVVELARHDGPRSFNPEGIFTQLLRDLFGMRIAHGLAHDGLEALRRFCVRAWYWDLIRTKDIRRLVGAGYSRSHAFEILAYVASFRGFSPSIQAVSA